MERCVLGGEHGLNVEPSWTGRPWSTDQCRACWKHYNPKGTVVKEEPFPCRFLGPPTGDGKECLPCREKNGGRVRLKTFRCLLHGECTKVTTVPGTACCQGCGDSSPPRILPGKKILLTAGIGDAIALEAMLIPKEREELTEIHYACPAAKEVSLLFRSLPGYPNLKTHVLHPTGDKAHYSRASVEAVTGPLPGVEDWSINRIFPQGRPFTSSSLLAGRLADVKLPSRPYVVVSAASTWGRWPGRDLDAEDWKTCLGILEKRDLLGIVLLRERRPVPVHPRLLDWQGRTDICESVEVVKGAVGYLGIDSCWSVLAAKLFPASRMWIKSNSGHFRDNIRAYMAPHKELSFVSPRLEEPSWD